MESENRLLLAKMRDVLRLCEKYHMPRFSTFLDGAQTAYIEDNFEIPYGYTMLMYGGYEGAERKIAGIFPEWYEASYAEFPIAVLKTEGGFKRELTHRDYLGSLMSLGIERQKTGDILPYGKGAYIILAEDMAEYVANNIRKIGNEGVKIQRIECSEIVVPQRKTERIETVCASTRIDAVVGAFCSISRKEASALIEGGMVRVNYREIFDGAKNLHDGDLVSVRGYGRFIFSGAGNSTRKGRLHISIDKFI